MKEVGLMTNVMAKATNNSAIETFTLETMRMEKYVEKVCINGLTEIYTTESG